MNKKYNISEQAREYRWQEYLRKEKDKRDKECLEKMLKSEEGRWIYSRILEIAGIRAQSFTGNSATFFREGMREVGIQLELMTLHLLEMEGVELRQKAERENIAFQERIRKYFESEEN